MTLLALDYRPKSFASLSGQNSVRLVLQALAFSGDIPPALLFSGPSGTGKTSAARIFAAALNCENPKNGDCCSECTSCISIHSGQSLSVQEIDAASNGGVDDIRALKELAQFSSDGNWRVILLDEAHSLSRQAFNALLKVLEEPPTNTVFVLLTTEPSKIMETVRSRAMPISFLPISSKTILDRLVEICDNEKLGIEKDALQAIAEDSEGGMRDAIMLLDQSNRVGATTLDGVRQLLNRTDIPQKIVTSLVVQDFSLGRVLLAEYFDTHSSSIELISGLIEDLQDRFVNNSISRDQLITSTKLLWDCRSLGDVVNRDTRIRIEALLTLLFAVFRSDKVVSPKPILPPKEIESQPEQPRLGLEEALELLEA
jgi:DNA polymerase-3 subunit gamma/tau